MESEHQDRHGVLMSGFGRWLVYSRPRAWLGSAVEVPALLRGVEVPRGAKCLDIATGLGWASAALFRRDPSAWIVALDYDGIILPRTREYLKSHGAGQRTSICRGDGKHLPFADGSFDLVLCLYGLHHVRGYSEALRDIARVLKPTGTFALIDPVRKVGGPPGHHGTDVPTPEELRSMVAEAGFETRRFRISFGSAKAVMRKANGTPASY